MVDRRVGADVSEDVFAHNRENLFVRVILLVVTWIGGVTLAEIQVWIGIASGAAILIYTLLNTYVLWRDKIRSKR